MHNKRGHVFLLKLGNGETPQTFFTVAGLRMTFEKIENSTMDFSATGIFLGSQAEMQIRASALSGSIGDYELAFEGGEKLRGKFVISRLDYSGDFNGERNYSITMQSSGGVSHA